MKPTKDNNKPEISRKEALKKIGNYGKYTALTALGTYMILNPKNHKQEVLLLIQVLDLDLKTIYLKLNKQKDP